MAAAAVAAVVLAAGRSRRFGGDRPKQLFEVEGVPLVRRAALAALGADAHEVLLVVGHRAAEVTAVVADLPLTVVRNERFGEGQSTSVRAAVAALSPRTRGALFLPCDQPWLEAAALDRLIACYRRGEGAIVVAAAGERRGAPVLFDRRFFAELAAIRGDRGGRPLVRRHGDQVAPCELGDPRALDDLDVRP